MTADPGDRGTGHLGELGRVMLSVAPKEILHDESFL